MSVNNPFVVALNVAGLPVIGALAVAGDYIPQIVTILAGVSGAAWYGLQIWESHFLRVRQRLHRRHRNQMRKANADPSRTNPSA
jgi:hypothetical protein